MLSDAETQSEYLERYRYAHDYWNPYYTDAQRYMLTSSGYSWSDDERKDLIKQGREPIEFNIMRRPIQFFSGYLRDNINQIIYSPVEGSDQKTADQLTKLGYYIWDKGQGFPVFLDGADECFKAGICLVGIRMDYSKDFVNGDIRFYKRTYNSFYLDPTFENIDLSDCSFGITRDILDKEYVKQLIPDVPEKEIDSLSLGYRDDKFLQYRPQTTSFSRNRNLIAYDQYYKRITRTRKFLIDKQTGYNRDISDVSRAEIKKLEYGIYRFDALRREGIIDDAEIPDLEIRSVERPYVELNIMLNGTRVFCGEDQTGIVHTYPFVPEICYFEPSIFMASQRIQGLAAVNYSLQRQFNKRHMKIQDMFDSSISTGYKYILGTVPDPSDMQQAGQNKLIGVSPDAPQGLASVEQLRGGEASPSLLEYQKILDQMSLTLANVNESVMGIDEGGNTQISGRLAEVRIAQGLRGNRKIMDNIETAQQVVGGLVMTCVQATYPPEKVKRILGEEPTEQFYDKNFEQYDAVIKEGVKSKSQKDAYYYELVNLKKDGVVDVPQAEIVKALSMAGASDLEDAIKKQDEGLAAAAAQAAEKEKMEIEVLSATKEEKLGLAKERITRSIGNLALKDERESEAQQNIAQAALDRAKAITEIASMHEDRILKVLQFVNQLEQQEAAGREAQKMQVGAQAQQISQQVDSTQAQGQQQAMLQQQQSEQNIMADMNQGV